MRKITAASNLRKMNEQKLIQEYKDKEKDDRLLITGCLLSPFIIAWGLIGFFYLCKWLLNLIS